jgi:predicted GNAT family acetyltransferase
MATLPAEGRWSLRLLSDDDFKGALEFLQRDPLINVYLISRLLEERTLAATQIAVVRYNGVIVLVASLATNIVLAGDPSISHDITDCAIALRKRLDYPDLTVSRYSTLRDLDQLVPACAAMHREEVGIDPLERDATGYRERIRELVEKKRSVIHTVEGVIVTKCEYSALTPDTAQLMGVWTHPNYRRRGLSREFLREVCGHLLHKGKTVTLFVNDFNRPAIALYESLGFHQIGMNRALIW